MISIKIDRALAVAMVNADVSGLSESEIKLIENFPNFNVINLYENESSINGTCYLTGLWSFCIEVEVQASQLRKI